MLYGTRKELNKKLKRMFGNEERYALLVWTKEDVLALSGNMTEAEAQTLLELIVPHGNGGAHRRRRVIPHRAGAVRRDSPGHSPRERPRRYAVSHHGHCRTGD